MTFLWTADELVTAMQARPVGQLPDGITGISIDTRTIQPGEAFFAIKGDRLDGHDFVIKAKHGGAALAVVSEEKLVMFGHLQMPLLVVTNVLTALTKLAQASRERSAARIIAVTGSVGKTSTKEMLRAALSTCGATHASSASHNNHWGVPLTLARMPRETAYGVFEIGMNHPGEITPLTKLVRPHIAIITVIAPAHLGAFRSVDEIAHAKAEIFSGLTRGGTAILNRDDPRFGLLSGLAWASRVRHVMSFGRKRGADFRLKSARLGPTSSTVEADIGPDAISYTIGAPGAHFVANSLAVLGAARAAGADLTRCAQALGGIRAEKGRGRSHTLKLPQGTARLIDESYNANPASMKAAIAVLGAAEPGPGGRRIAVLGDMLELGRSSARLHRGLRKQIEAAGIDKVLLIGRHMGALAKDLPRQMLAGHHEDVASAEAPLLALVQAGDIVTVKSSLGTGSAGLVEALLREFPETGEAAG